MVDGLTRLVQQLRGIGAQVLVLGPVPNPYKSVPICLSGHLDDATACSSPRSTAINQSGIATETAATKAGGGQYDDLTDLFCTADRCPVVVGNTMVYFDDHLTSEYARALAPQWGRWPTARSPAVDLSADCRAAADEARSQQSRGGSRAPTALEHQVRYQSSCRRYGQS